MRVYRCSPHTRNSEKNRAKSWRFQGYRAPTNGQANKADASKHPNTQQRHYARYPQVQQTPVLGFPHYPQIGYQFSTGPHLPRKPCRIDDHSISR